MAEIAAKAARLDLKTVRDWPAQVPDPEIPVISLTDLGVIRDVEWLDVTLIVTVTPTCSGCPASSVINLDIETVLRAQRSRSCCCNASFRSPGPPTGSPPKAERSCTAKRVAGSLSYGSLKRLEIARAMALKPKVPLLDEPVAGCNAMETKEIDHLVADCAASGVAILLVEHDMKTVMRISHHIVVLDHGEKTARRDPTSVSRNPAVMAACPVSPPGAMSVAACRNRSKGGRSSPTCR